MLKLPSVTLISVSTKDVEQAAEAIIKSYQSIEWGAVKLLSHYRPDNLPDNCSHIHIDTFPTIDEWNKYIVYELYKVVDTEYCMLIHPDGYVIHPEMWRPEFLHYDYIGAPWPSGCHYDTRGNEVRVGNSISIRSKRLLEFPSQWSLPWEQYNDSYNEDTQICVRWRELMEHQGITYAPIEVAKYFSHEIPVPEVEGITPFAFHSWEPEEPKYQRFNLSDCYISYVNLDSRPDRNEHMLQQLQKVGIQATRQKGILPEEVKSYIDESKLAVMWNRTKGAVGCHYSQVMIMETALQNKQHAFVMEDDLIFCEDFQERLQMIEEFLSEREWDIMWLGGTYHKDPTWHRAHNGVHTHMDLQLCTCNLNRDWEHTDNNRFVKTYGCWSTYAYIVNRKRLAHILDLLDQNVYRSMGIDWLFIYLQPQLNTFAFVPGCVKQFDNQSNIGNGVTRFSVFESLGSHWYSDKM